MRLADDAMQRPPIVQAHLELEDRSAKILLEPEMLSVGSTADCNIVLDDSAVSGRHAIFRKMGSFWLIQDLGSTNGTWVNGRRIDRPTRLNSGDQIAFGRARFVLRSEGELSRRVFDKILALSAYGFEQLVGELFTKLSFETLVTRQGTDGGIDVVAVNKGVIFRGRYLIQCKRYNPSNKVSRPEVQAFHGRIAVEPRARGIFITTSSFTRGAQKFAELTGINLIDGPELERLIIRHSLFDSQG
jgi:pSer/pThr/pTyr-binding forkhead associated (FHA) protein